MLFGVLAAGTVASIPAIAFRTENLPDVDGDPRVTLVAHAARLSLAGLPAEAIAGAVLGLGLWLAARPYVPGVTRLVLASMAGAALGQLAVSFFVLMVPGVLAAVALVVTGGSLGPQTTEVGRLIVLICFSSPAPLGIALAHSHVLRWRPSGKVVWFATIMSLGMLDGVWGWWILGSDWEFATIGLLLVLREVPLTAVVLSAALLFVVRKERTALPENS